MNYTEQLTIIGVQAQGQNVVVMLQRADGSTFTVTDVIANVGNYVLSSTHTLTIA